MIIKNVRSKKRTIKSGIIIIFDILKFILKYITLPIEPTNITMIRRKNLSRKVAPNE